MKSPPLTPPTGILSLAISLSLFVALSRASTRPGHNQCGLSETWPQQPLALAPSQVDCLGFVPKWIAPPRHGMALNLPSARLILRQSCSSWLTAQSAGLLRQSYSVGWKHSTCSAGKNMFGSCGESDADRRKLHPEFADVSQNYLTNGPWWSQNVLGPSCSLFFGAGQITV